MYINIKYLLGKYQWRQSPCLCMAIAIHLKIWLGSGFSGELNEEN